MDASASINAAGQVENIINVPSSNSYSANVAIGGKGGSGASGTLNPAGPGVIGTTTIYGNYTQTNTGVLAIDIDSTASQKADLLRIVGNSSYVGGVLNLAGTYAPVATKLLPGTLQILTFTAPGAFANATVTPSLLFDWGPREL